MTYNVNGELIELSEGNGIMVNSRQLHYGFSCKHHECEFICILLSTELLQGNEWFYQNFIEPITENSSYPYLYLDQSDWKASIIEKLDALYPSFCTDSIAPMSYFALQETFVSVMKLLYENLNVENREQAEETSEITALKSMISYIEEHFAEHITLERIALSGACCKSRCSLLFKKYLRDTPMTYTTKLRLRKSLVALLNSDKSIADIAYEYGFCGASYYCEIFRKYYGTSPLKYRRAH